MVYFLQSAEWEAFQQALGFETHRLDDRLLIKKPLPLRQHYWYSPRPMMSKKLIEDLSRFVGDQKSLFARIDPDLSHLSRYSVLGTRYTVHPIPSTQPQHTLILDLRDPKALLPSFHSKTRYNIRLAERKRINKKIKIREFFDSEGVDYFIKLAQLTERRHKIRFHHPQYYQTMLQVLGADPQTQNNAVSVLVAFYQGEAIAANIMLWSKKTAYYLHSASDHNARALKAPHLLQWHGIKLAYERNKNHYDFWGVAPPLSKITNDKSQIIKYQYDLNHPWAGITRFKLGFGGTIISYPASFDLTTRALAYHLYRIIKNLKSAI